LIEFINSLLQGPVMVYSPSANKMIKWIFLASLFSGIVCALDEQPLENQCKKYIEKAIHNLKEQGDNGVNTDGLDIELSTESNETNDGDVNSGEFPGSEEATNLEDQDESVEVAVENESETNTKEKVTSVEALGAEDNTTEDSNEDQDNKSYEHPNEQNSQSDDNIDSTSTENNETKTIASIEEDTNDDSVIESESNLSQENSLPEGSSSQKEKKESVEVLQENERERQLETSVHDVSDEKTENLVANVSEDKQESSVETVSEEYEEIKKTQDSSIKNESSEETSKTDNDEGESQTEEDSGEIRELPEDDLTIEFEIPKHLRDRRHITQLLSLDQDTTDKEISIRKASNVILNDLKKIYENAIKPLEQLYKYRDLSNRHFGDPEIFSKPLVLFMGPWSGGKSTILNYLTDNEYTPYSIRSGAEPSPAHFNILMYGNETEILDGTQIAADWTFSGLQKFGQAFLERLRAVKIPNKLLEKVNIVEIPGILEVRKQVSRLFPFNDACQWFIDRADLIFLVYDPSKLDVGPETEAILDQLKGREYQTRILLNKADLVKPEELLRVQNALIWNISPLMSSIQPPLLYTVSLWSHPFQSGAPVRLLQAQEKALLIDLREAINKRIENKIASARRFAVRVRNHAKMIDCYLTTYYNHKSLFGNKKQISQHIIENPQTYHIYEGLSTLTNISRYDLPDPETYREFFNLNPLYTFKRLSETCTYFRGCPLNKLDVAIAYDLPDLVGKYKKLVEV